MRVGPRSNRPGADQRRQPALQGATQPAGAVGAASWAREWDPPWTDADQTAWQAARRAAGVEGAGESRGRRITFDELIEQAWRRQGDRSGASPIVLPMPAGCATVGPAQTGPAPVPESIAQAGQRPQPQPTFANLIARGVAAPGVASGRRQWRRAPVRDAVSPTSVAALIDASHDARGDGSAARRAEQDLLARLTDRGVPIEAKRDIRTRCLQTVRAPGGGRVARGIACIAAFEASRLGLGEEAAAIASRVIDEPFLGTTFGDALEEPNPAELASRGRSVSEQEIFRACEALPLRVDMERGSVRRSTRDDPTGDGVGGPSSGLSACLHHDDLSPGTGHWTCTVEDRRGDRRALLLFDSAGLGESRLGDVRRRAGAAWGTAPAAISVSSLNLQSDSPSGCGPIVCDFLDALSRSGGSDDLAGFARAYGDAWQALGEEGRRHVVDGWRARMLAAL